MKVKTGVKGGCAQTQTKAGSCGENKNPDPGTCRCDS